MLVRNTITWTSLIKGCLENEDFVAGFSVFCDMCKFGEKFNEHTCVVILQACSEIGDVILGEQIHGFVIKSAYEENVFVGTSLISMYSRSGNFDEAEKVFHGLGCKDLRCLNCMILEYGKGGYEKRAVGVFIYLISVGLEPNDYTFTNIISTCNVEEGKQLHGLAVKYGVLLQTSVGNAVINMYGKNEMVEEAERMFSVMNKKNMISWTALISGYTRSGYGEKAVDGFLELLCCGVECDSGLLATILDGCSECKNLELGTQIHGLVIKLGHPCDINIGTALIDLYAKCKNLQSARTVFNGLFPRSTASFNAILVGFIENDGNEEDPMAFLSQLRLAGIKPDSAKRPYCYIKRWRRNGFTPDEITILVILQACTYSGRAIYHEPWILLTEVPFQSQLCSGELWSMCGSYVLVSNMYAGEGMIDEASKVRTAMKDLKLSKEAGRSWVEIDNMVHHFVASGTDHPESIEIYARLDLLRDEMKGRCDSKADLDLIYESV
ncbi:hypothetical protein OIU77_029783 [Salix suchowensis]|uniref:Pentatricopeptide repeat-containing protein n=1 Tax=Salix suchowensis TaxID=1278906 RepID=A0ABQ9BCX6_9ROSI|nr:hypothetical protein OIU77_029783 [Salix suchowensis]